MVKPDATDEQIRIALKYAKILKTVDGKGGLDIVVGNSGSTFSGGERHRIGLARAFLGIAPVMVFDEPTGDLDVDTAKEIIQSIKRITRGKTAIIVTHAPLDALEFDRVIVMKKGKIVEDGNPLDLQKSGGEFSKMLDKSVGKITGSLAIIQKSRIRQK